MRRSHSAPSLAPSSAGSSQGTAVLGLSRRGFGSCSTLSNMQHSCSKDDALPAAALGGQPMGSRPLKPLKTGRPRDTRARAFLLGHADLPVTPPPPEATQSLEQRAERWLEKEVEGAEEWIVEGASHGLADTTCFELYGFPEVAPALIDSPDARQQEATRQSKMAACLATPGPTGQERGMGELLNSTVRRLSVQSDLETQMRYAAELRAKAMEEEIAELDSPNRSIALADIAARRRRKDPEEDTLDEEAMLAEVACTAPAAPAAMSPESRSHLDSIFGSYADESNMLTIDEDDSFSKLPTMGAALQLRPEPAPLFDAGLALNAPDNTADRSMETNSFIAERTADSNWTVTAGSRGQVLSQTLRKTLSDISEGDEALSPGSGSRPVSPAPQGSGRTARPEGLPAVRRDKGLAGNNAVPWRRGAAQTDSPSKHVSSA